MIRIPVAALVAPLLVVALVGCQSPGGGGGDDPGVQPQPAFDDDPGFADDPDVDAAIVTSDWMGKQLTGFTCDVTDYIDAESAVREPRDGASIGVGPGGSSFDFGDPGGTSVAQGPSDRPPTTFQNTVTISGTGWWHVGDGGENTPWETSASLHLTEIPVPVDGCPGAWVWFLVMFHDENLSAAEMIEAYTADGLTRSSEVCPDFWVDWIPPDMTCEAFDLRYETG